MTISKDPAEGAQAPEFALPTPDGDVALSGFAGRKLILYFYPKDATPGCTTEATDFTAGSAAFNAAGATVVGVSKDSVSSHASFIAKHALGVILASDQEGSTSEDYGVWVEKNMYGRKFMGIERATFLIDGAGIVRRVWRKVKVKGHVAEVLSATQELG